MLHLQHLHDAALIAVLTFLAAIGVATIAPQIQTPAEMTTQAEKADARQIDVPTPRQKPAEIAIVSSDDRHKAIEQRPLDYLQLTIDPKLNTLQQLMQKQQARAADLEQRINRLEQSGRDGERQRREQLGTGP